MTREAEREWEAYCQGWADGAARERTRLVEVEAENERLGARLAHAEALCCHDCFVEGLDRYPGADT